MRGARTPTRKRRRTIADHLTAVVIASLSVCPAGGKGRTMSEALTQKHLRPKGPLGRALDQSCRAFALGGGLILAAMACMSVVSVVGRATIGKPITGDFELVQLGCAM